MPDRQTIVDLLARQIRLQEARAGRRAVGACVAMPAYINGPEVYAMLRRAVRGAVAHHLEIEVVEVDGEPRLLTVDFELQEAS